MTISNRDMVRRPPWSKRTDRCEARIDRCIMNRIDQPVDVIGPPIVEQVFAENSIVICGIASIIDDRARAQHRASAGERSLRLALV